jgi:hypothetical protein
VRVRVSVWVVGCEGMAVADPEFFDMRNFSFEAWDSDETLGE